MMKHRTGFILLEVLVSLSVSTFMLASLLQLFLAQKKMYDSTHAFVQVQENAYWAMGLLKQSIHRSGYIGCMKLTMDTDLYNPTEELLTANNYLTINDEQMAPAKKTDHTDHLTVRYLDSNTASIQHHMDSHHHVVTDNLVDFKVGDLIMIADCDKADMTRIKTIKHQANQQWLELEHPIRYYTKGSQVGKIHIETYYIADSQRYDHKNNPTRSLFIATPTHHDELIEAIDDMILRETSNEPISVIEISLELNSLTAPVYQKTVSTTVRRRV